MAAGRLLKPRDSIAHVWADGTITAFQPGTEVDERDILEGDPRERKAFIDEAVAKGLFQDVTPEEEGESRRPAGRKAGP
jgi:hypothetical protein